MRCSLLKVVLPSVILLLGHHGDVLASDYGFRVVPKPLVPITETSDQLDDTKTAHLFPTTGPPIVIGNTVELTMPWSMLETQVHWARLKVLGTVGESGLPDSILRAIGSGKNRLPTCNVAAFFREIIPTREPELPEETFMISPSALEKSVSESSDTRPAFGETAVVVQFSEIGLPSSSDVDRRHIHRTVFLLVEWDGSRSLRDVLQQLGSSTARSPRRQQAESELNAGGRPMSIIAEFRQRIRFVH